MVDALAVIMVSLAAAVCCAGAWLLIPVVVTIWDAITGIWYMNR